ncbi:acyltransferase family protein [Lentzea atacamensis]|uniref:acyltransferase family protein n=1 Tax=Lentzea atacamensis TaxID=531938 RepID=UPI00147556CE|nr:acyltransferase family protein [Lentzea atacamensis]
MLRAVAILFVVAQHATWGGPLLVPELGARPFEMSVQVGASALMVISAYFICQTLSSSGAWLLLRNRLGRMLPPFAVASMATFVVTRWLGPDALHRDGEDLVATLLVLPPALSVDLDLVDPSYWTVPLQVMAFITAALLWRTRSWDGWCLQAVLWAAVIAPIAISAVVLPLDGSGSLAALHGDLGVHRTHLFAAGAALWLWATGRAGHALLLLIPQPWRHTTSTPKTCPRLSRWVWRAASSPPPRPARTGHIPPCVHSPGWPASPTASTWSTTTSATR